MTDPWQNDTEPLPPARQRTFSTGAIAALSILLALLAIGGGMVGWKLADVELDGTSASPDPTPSSMPPSATRSPSAAPTESTTPSSEIESPSTSPSGPIMPQDAIGEDFQQVREQILSYDGYQVVLKFDADGAPDGSVVRTSPEPGSPLTKGRDVTLWVAGSAPQLDMPDVVGDSCRKAKDELLEAGLKIGRYTSGREGNVEATVPEAGAVVAWNHQVTLTCRLATPSPSAAW